MLHISSFPSPLNLNYAQLCLSPTAKNRMVQYISVNNMNVYHVCYRTLICPDYLYNCAKHARCTR